MKQIIKAVAINTFRETIRDKILYVILLFALGFTLISGITSQWSINQERKILQDFGFAIITIFGLLIAVFIGAGLIYKEIDRRTIYTVLAKPISRAEFIIGKYFGLLLTLLINFVLMGIGFFILYWLFTGEIRIKLLSVVGMIYLQMTVVVAIVLFLSTFMSWIVSAMLSIFIYFAGNFSADIFSLGPGTKNIILQKFLYLIFYLLPNFSLINIQMSIVHDLPIQNIVVVKGIIYSIAYTALLVICSIEIFKRKNLK